MKKSVRFLIFFLPAGLLANLPTGATIESGSVSILQNDNTLNITQSTNKAIIGWDSFDISSGNVLHIIQPSHTSILLNRISGGPSTIAGIIKASGQVFLINPAGLVFTKSAMIDVHGLVATTANISNKDFLQGNWVFQQDPNFANSKVIFEGSVVTGEQGYVVLAGPQVRHSGYIVAKQGKVQLGAGTAFTLDLYGDGLINFSASEDIHELEVTGTIDVSENPVLLSPNQARKVSSQSVNLSGDTVATSVSKRGGTIVFGGGDINVNNKVFAKGEAGGKVVVAGTQVVLSENAQLDVSGTYKSGEISLGNIRSYIQGLPESEYTKIASGSELISSSPMGDAGKIVVWSKAKTDFAGYIEASSKHGDGGFVEVSGIDLWFRGNVNTSSVYGKNGMLLLDPDMVLVVDSVQVDDTIPIDNKIKKAAAVNIPSAPTNVVDFQDLAQNNNNPQNGTVNIVDNPDSTNDNNTSVLGDESDSSSSFSDDQIEALLNSNNITIEATSEIIFNFPVVNTTSTNKLTLKAPTVRVNNKEISVRDLFFDADNVYGLGSLGTNSNLTQMIVAGKGTTVVMPYDTSGPALSSANSNLNLIVKDLKINGNGSKRAISLYNMKRFELDNVVVESGFDGTEGGGLYHNAPVGTKVAEIVMKNTQFINNTNPIAIGQANSVSFENVSLGSGNSGSIKFNANVNSVSGSLSVTLPAAGLFTIESLGAGQLAWNNYSGTTVNVMGNANADLLVKNIHFNGSSTTKANEILKVDTVKDLTLDNVKLEGALKGLEVNVLKNDIKIINNSTISEVNYSGYVGLLINSLDGKYHYNGTDVFEFTGTGKVEQNILDTNIAQGRLILNSTNDVNMLGVVPGYINHFIVDVPKVTGNLIFTSGPFLILQGSSTKTEVVNPNISLGSFEGVMFIMLKFDGNNQDEVGLSFSASNLNSIYLSNSLIENASKGLEITNMKTGANLYIQNTSFNNNADVMAASNTSNIGLVSLSGVNIDNTNSGKFTITGKMSDFTMTNSQVNVPIHFNRPNGFAVDFGNATTTDTDTNHYSINKLNKWLGYDIDLEFSIKYSMDINSNLISDSANKLIFNTYYLISNNTIDLKNADVEINKPTTFTLSQGDIDTLNIWGASEGLAIMNGAVVNSKTLKLNVGKVRDLSNVGLNNAQMVVEGMPLLNGVPQTEVSRSNYSALGSNVTDLNANLTFKNLRVIGDSGQIGNVNTKKVSVFKKLNNLTLNDVILGSSPEDGLKIDILAGSLTLKNVSIANTANPIKVNQVKAVILDNLTISQNNTGSSDFGKVESFDLRSNNIIKRPFFFEISDKLVNDTNSILSFELGSGKLDFDKYGVNDLATLTITSDNKLNLLDNNFINLPHIIKVKFDLNEVNGDLKANVASSGLTLEGKNTQTNFINGGLVLTAGLDRDIKIINLTVDRNENGRAILIDNAKNLELNKVIIANSKVNDDGAALRVTEVAETLKIIDSTFTNNKASNGGAIYAGKVIGLVTLKDSRFVKNTSDNSGGAVAITDGVAGVLSDSSTFSDNAAKLGGAIYSKNSLEISSSLFFGNVADKSEVVYSPLGFKIRSMLFSPNFQPLDLLFAYPEISVNFLSEPKFVKVIDLIKLESTLRDYNDRDEF